MCVPVLCVVLFCLCVLYSDSIAGLLVVVCCMLCNFFVVVVVVILVVIVFVIVVQATCIAASVLFRDPFCR